MKGVLINKDGVVVEIDTDNYSAESGVYNYHDEIRPARALDKMFEGDVFDINNLTHMNSAVRVNSFNYDLNVFIDEGFLKKIKNGDKK